MCWTLLAWEGICTALTRADNATSKRNIPVGKVHLNAQFSVDHLVQVYANIPLLRTFDWMILNTAFYSYCTVKISVETAVHDTCSRIKPIRSKIQKKS
jgi:hypothetical protein